MALSVEQRFLLSTMSAQERVELLASRYHKTTRAPAEVPGQMELFLYDCGDVPVDTMREDRLEPIRREIAKAERWHREHDSK